MLSDASGTVSSPIASCSRWRAPEDLERHVVAQPLLDEVREAVERRAGHVPVNKLVDDVVLACARRQLDAALVADSLGCAEVPLDDPQLG
jgi:hypothetical protein